MTRGAFLDTGVALAFCFKTDTHHHRCREYIEQNVYELYASELVVREFDGREPDLAERQSDGIFEHIMHLRQSAYEGQLDSLDMAQIRQQELSTKNPAYPVLFDFYQNEIGMYILFDELIGRLRDLARDIDQNAQERRSELFDLIELWSRSEEYPTIDEALSSIHGSDRHICLDAHDLARNRDDATELATTNPNDFVRNGHRELILTETALDDVISLAVSR